MSERTNKNKKKSNPQIKSEYSDDEYETFVEPKPTTSAAVADEESKAKITNIQTKRNRSSSSDDEKNPSVLKKSNSKQSLQTKDSQLEIKRKTSIKVSKKPSITSQVAKMKIVEAPTSLVLNSEPFQQMDSKLTRESDINRMLEKADLPIKNRMKTPVKLEASPPESLPKEIKSKWTSGHWGNLQFYENNNLVFSNELWGYQPILVNANTVIGIKQIYEDMNRQNYNKLMNFTDWQLAIDEGFVIERASGDKGVITLKLDSCTIKGNQYKVFVRSHNMDVEIPIKENGRYEIYNSTFITNNMKEKVLNLDQAHEFSQSCYLVIAIYGKFLENFPIPLSFEAIKRRIVPSLPYWFLLKLNPEYFELDTHIRSVLS